MLACTPPPSLSHRIPHNTTKRKQNKRILPAFQVTAANDRFRCRWLGGIGICRPRGNRWKFSVTSINGGRPSVRQRCGRCRRDISRFLPEYFTTFPCPHFRTRNNTTKTKVLIPCAVTYSMIHTKGNVFIPKSISRIKQFYGIIWTNGHWIRTDIRRLELAGITRNCWCTCVKREREKRENCPNWQDKRGWAKSRW